MVAHQRYRLRSLRSLRLVPAPCGVGGWAQCWHVVAGVRMMGGACVGVGLPWGGVKRQRSGTLSLGEKCVWHPSGMVWGPVSKAGRSERQ